MPPIDPLLADWAPPVRRVFAFLARAVTPDLQIPALDGMKRLRSVLVAVLLGVGTIFGIKGDPDTHWSEPPNWGEPVEEASALDGTDKLT